MLRYVALTLFLSCVHTQNNGDLESVIKQIFGDPNTASSSPQTNLEQNVNNLFPTPKPTQGQVAPVTPATPATTATTGTTGSLNLDQANRGPSEDPKDMSCTTETGEAGECVQYYLCNSNNSIITDGVGIIDIRVRDGPCESYLDTCCLVSDRRPPDQPITPSPNTNQPAREGCGWRNPDGVDVRTKGDNNHEAKFGEFPWMVAILKVEPVNADDPQSQRLNVYVGGGSLIHPSVTLTAAHYVAVARSLRVRAGEWDTQTKNELYPFQDRDVAEIKLHKDFNAGTLFYDVALLFLAEPMTMAPNVGLACLPPRMDRPRPATRCFVSGWGKDSYGKEGRYQVILKRVEVPVVDRPSCQESLRKTRLGRFFELHSSFMCAGGEAGKDTCKGDGGSPLVCPVELEAGRYQQNGIVAWGIGCGEDGTPGVYVDVAKLRDWIDDGVAGKGYDPKAYEA